ncbi:hypothetical protein ZWY2020_058154 [Hordeum vulgare]|nr:hypothetical protein ZWY2020_058154 [Hordeum vulgare]
MGGGTREADSLPPACCRDRNLSPGRTGRTCPPRPPLLAIPAPPHRYQPHHVLPQLPPSTGHGNGNGENRGRTGSTKKKQHRGQSPAAGAVPPPGTSAPSMVATPTHDSNLNRVECFKCGTFRDAQNSCTTPCCYMC